MTFKDYILGQTEPALFAAAVFFASIGVLFVLLMGTKLRNPDSPESPEKFSWKYLWWDNLRRIIASGIAVLVTLRFMPEVFNIELNMWRAFCVGTLWDGIALLLKQKTNIFDRIKKE